MAKQNIKNSFLGMCPICRNKLKIGNSNIINKNDFADLYCVECNDCLSSVMLAVFSIKDGIVTTMGILTDIQKEEIGLIKNSEQITIDSILNLYDNINSNNSNKKYETKCKK